MNFVARFSSMNFLRVANSDREREYMREGGGEAPSSKSIFRS